jgi:hypothetical protein
MLKEQKMNSYQNTCYYTNTNVRDLEWGRKIKILGWNGP